MMNAIREMLGIKPKSHEAILVASQVKLAVEQNSAVRQDLEGTIQEFLDDAKRLRKRTGYHNG